MSLVLAVRDDQDLVMASDGRVLGEDLSVLSDRSPKTLALNAKLCVGLTGSTDMIRQVLTPLGVNCRGSHPIDLLSLCQDGACPVDVDYGDARDEVTHVLRWMTHRTRRRTHRREIPTVILAGEDRKHPALCEWYPPAQTMETLGSAGYSEAVAGSPPAEGTREWFAFRRIVNGERSTQRAEERLAHAIRFCARMFGAAGPISRTVFLRRLSTGFELHRMDS